MSAHLSLCGFVNGFVRLCGVCYAHPHSSKASRFSGGVTVIVPLNEYDFLKRALVAHSTKEAVVCGDVRLTYASFGERVRRWANAMHALGVRKGDRVAMLSQNCHRMLEAFFGAPLVGA